MINNKWIIILIGITLICIVFLILIFQNIIPISVNYQPLASLAPLLGIFASLVTLIKSLLPQWLESMNKPKLEFKELAKSNIFERSSFYQFSYCIKIKKIKGVGNAKCVQGFITIEGTNIQHIPLKWYLQNPYCINIQDYDYLWLFSFMNFKEQSKIIVEHTSEQIKGYFSEFFKDVKNKKVTISIKSENSIDPEPFTDTIEGIMNKSTTF